VHASQMLQIIAGGGLRLSMTVGNLLPVVSWVLEWGGRARVVEPPELIERVKAELEAALAQYGDAPSDPAARARGAPARDAAKRR
jgi:predicted DNA-binding transcriptional regulator YafY